jgi:hypothetical protein
MIKTTSIAKKEILMFESDNFAISVHVPQNCSKASEVKLYQKTNDNTKWDLLQTFTEEKKADMAFIGKLLEELSTQIEDEIPF